MWIKIFGQWFELKGKALRRYMFHKKYGFWPLGDLDV